MKKTNIIRKVIAGVLAAVMCLALAACGSEAAAPAADTSADSQAKTTYTIGLCNYVDDASLNQIVDNIQTRLAEIGEEKGVEFNVLYDNCNADASVMEQIISDYLDTDAIMNLIFTLDPDAETIGLLYDQGQDSSAAPIEKAKEYLDNKGVKYIERTGTTTDEVMLAADALVADKVDAVFTPTDNTIMTAELAIYETFAKAGIPQYTGADSFALNGAFLGYGVDYANLGVETANMAAQILLEGADPASTPVMTFDNGTATINTDICAELGYDYADVEEAFTSLCSRIVTLTTAESFDDIK